MLCKGEIVEAERNPQGAVAARFPGGELLGLKPGEYEIIRDDSARDAEIEGLRKACEFAHTAIVAAISFDEGLDGADGAAVMQMLEDAVPAIKNKMREAAGGGGG